MLWVMRSSSYLRGCDRAVTALPGQSRPGHPPAAPGLRHGESPRARAAASRESDARGEAAGKGREGKGEPR